MKTSRTLPVVAVLTAVAITSAMDASGLAEYSTFPLFPLAALFWYLQRFSPKEIGFALGRMRHYGIAMLHPLLVLGLTALIAWVTGAVHPEQFHWKTAWLNFLIVAVSTFVVVMITEEGFFRGWLWASLERAGQNERSVLAWSSLAFALWHWSWACLESGLSLPLAQVPIFMVNAVMMGAIWGMLRSISGSLVVSSFCHGVWNGGAYVFFDVGKHHIGQLGIRENAVYNPEVGVLGLALNLVFAAVLWQWCERERLRRPTGIARDTTSLAVT